MMDMRARARQSRLRAALFCALLLTLVTGSSVAGAAPPAARLTS
jgi:hypothetical protein